MIQNQHRKHDVYGGGQSHNQYVLIMQDFKVLVLSKALV